MKIGKYTLSVVCANKTYDGMYGDIYSSVEECIKEHPFDDVLYGYYLECEGEETPDWFDTLEEAVAYASGVTPKNETINKVSFEIEHFHGDTYFGFMVEIKKNGEIEICEEKGCSLADVDGDYIFDTDNDLYRMQADMPLDHTSFRVSNEKYNEVCKEGV